MRKVLIATLSAGILFAVTGPASALTATNTFSVTATVVKNCLVSGSTLAFGSYTPTLGALTANSTISVRCTKGTIYTVSLNGGTGGTLAQRLMKSGTDALQYNLYTTAGFATVFGDGTGGTATVGSTGNGMSVGSATTHTVYGSLPDNTANQDAAVSAAYTDTITVTVTY